ncbi:MAG: 50S ribosomal protein L19 [bacterium]
MIAKALARIHSENMRKEPLPAFAIGDTVKVSVKIREGAKERLQAYEGIVIARDGHAATETFTVRRLSHGVGVERVFPLQSPNLAKLEVESSGHTRRAKLYYLRDRTGKRAKLRNKARAVVARPSKPAAVAPADKG